MHRSLLFTAAFLAACQSAPPAEDAPPQQRAETATSGGSAQPPAEQSGATVTVDKTAYTRDATVTFRVTNRTTDTLGYNQCSSRSFERRQGSEWRAHSEVGRMCTMEIRLLNPGETQTATTEVPSDAPTGTWRLVLTLGRQRVAPPGSQNAVRAVSSSFEVR